MFQSNATKLTWADLKQLDGKELDPLGLCEYLFYGFVTAQNTVLKNVKYLPAELPQANNEDLSTEDVLTLFDDYLIPKHLRERKFLLCYSNGRDSNAILSWFLRNGLQDQLTLLHHVNIKDTRCEQIVKDIERVAEYYNLKLIISTSRDFEQVDPDRLMQFIRSCPFPCSDSVFHFYAQLKTLNCEDYIILDGGGNDKCFGIPTSKKKVLRYYLSKLTCSNYLNNQVRSASLGNPIFQVPERILYSTSGLSINEIHELTNLKYKPHYNWNTNNVSKEIEYNLLNSLAERQHIEKFKNAMTGLKLDFFLPFEEYKIRSIILNQKIRERYAGKSILNLYIGSCIDEELLNIENFGFEFDYVNTTSQIISSLDFNMLHIDKKYFNELQIINYTYGNKDQRSKREWSWIHRLINLLIWHSDE